MKDAMATKNKSEPLVLVVDDFADAREMYGEYLKFCGFRVAEAQNGVEAIDKAKRLKPDLILMDLSMPVVDGWEATRRLKADSSTKGCCSIASHLRSLDNFTPPMVNLPSTIRAWIRPSAIRSRSTAPSVLAGIISESLLSSTKFAEFSLASSLT